MRIIIQRVSEAYVVINGKGRREIENGLTLLIGICNEDDEKTAKLMAEKTANLRIFSDDGCALNRSLLDTGGSVLAISNFTLYADCKKGRRPSFTGAAPQQIAMPLYEYFVSALSDAGIKDVKTGEFGADMQVGIVNDGPVTILLDSDDTNLKLKSR